MNKIKILFIWHAAVVETYQKYIAELAEHSDLEITLLLPKWGIEGSQRIKAFIPLNAKYKVRAASRFYPRDNLISIYPLLPYYLWKIKPDLIHLFEEPYHNIAAYLLFWMKFICPKAKLIFQTFQNQIEDYPDNWVQMQNAVFNRSSSAIANSSEIKEVLLHWGYKKPIRVIYPGVETKLFSPKDPLEIRHRLGLKDFTIGYFGRMLKEKGIEDLINACKKLNFPYQFLFIGNGKDKEYFKTLTDKAIWVDAVDPNKISEYYSALNLLVLPSRTTPQWKEQFGRVLVEAMLCGVPVIGSSSGEIPNIIGEAGLIFNEQNPQDLAEKIKAIHDHQSLRDRLVIKGLERGCEFDWKRTADKAYELYKSI